MKVISVLLIILLYTSAAFAQSGELPKIAVYATGNLNENEKRALEMEMLNALLNSRQFSWGSSVAFSAEMEKRSAASDGKGLDDNQISLMGEQFGLKAVCIVEVVSAFGSHQISARIINVRTAETRRYGTASGHLNSMEALETLSASVVRNMFITKTAQVQSELPTQTVHTQSTPATARHHHVAPAVQDFTGAERLGTWFLNTIIPGIGSAIIMNDGAGFVIQAGTYALGWVGILNGFNDVKDDYGVIHKRRGNEPNALFFVGLGSFGFYAIFNVARSVTYTKPASRVTAINDHPQGLNFAVLPDKDGSLKAHAVYSMEF